MPWSSSRVVPQPEGQPSKKRSERFGGGRQQKGITMEDLKKQTALRLATEQRHRQGQQGGRGYPVSHVGRDHDAAPSANKNEAYTNGGNVYGRSPYHRAPHHQHSYHPQNVSPYQSTPNESSVSSEGSGAGPLMPSSGNRRNGSHYEPTITPRVDTRTSPTLAYDRSKNNSVRVHPNSTPLPSPAPSSNSNYSSSPSSRSSSGEQQRSGIQKASSFSRTSSSKSTDSATQSKQNNKSKLPHGLTVQELKEMTRARLQAEAADGKSATDKAVLSAAVIPPPRNLQTPEPLQSSVYQQTASPRHQHDAWSQDSRGPEAWDNASVSTCASDAYLSTGGGDHLAAPPPPPPCSSHRQQVGGELDDYHNAAPFVRSRSYPVSSSSSNSNSSNLVPPQLNGTAAPSSPYYHQQDGSGAPPVHSGLGGGYGANMHLQNRRRAQTLSPRIGLSYVHEDRPAIMGSADMIPFPQATSSLPPSQKPSLQPQHRQHEQNGTSSTYTTNGVAPPMRYGNSAAPIGSSGMYGGEIGSNNGTINRQRTSSTTSLPAISSTADEFGLEQTTSTSSRFAAQFGASSIREDQPLATPGLSDVFRGSGFGTAASTSSSTAPPGLAMSGGMSESLGISTSSSGGGQGLYPAPIGDSRMRAATWSEPATATADAVFSGLLCGDQLSDDLASILKLSGASEENKPSSSDNGGFDLLFSGPPPGL